MSKVTEETHCACSLMNTNKTQTNQAIRHIKLRSPRQCQSHGARTMPPACTCVASNKNAVYSANILCDL